MLNYHSIERDLLNKVAQSDEAAFTKLYYFWEPQLSSFIYRITKSKEVSAEIVHDVFMKIWMSRETLSEVKNFKSFLFVVSRNLAINSFHKAMRETERLKSLEEINFFESESDYELKSMQYSIIDQAIDMLSPRQKEVFLLNRVERYTYNEIAKKLNISKESVKTHIKLATKSLRKQIISSLSMWLVFILNIC